MRFASIFFIAATIVVTPLAQADGPAFNAPIEVRPVPPKGAKIAEEDLASLKKELLETATQFAMDEGRYHRDAIKLDLLNDIDIYLTAVRFGIKHNELYVDKNRDDVKVAKAHLATAKKRLNELREGNPGWTTSRGQVVRGYRSKIDGSVQPYGLVIHKDYDPKKPARLDFWWHGRGELLTEINFIEVREKSAGEFPPTDPQMIVVHPYGRYCNANKFAGEIDTLEVLDHVKKHYIIDESKIVARGFSMGGAACWQFAVHYPTLWKAAAPGAGFSETPEFLDVYQKEKVTPSWYEKKLWRMYNATDYAGNIFNIPTVAYSGENDIQKQAADVMAREMKTLGLELTHIIGPKTGHSYEKEAKKQITEKIDAAVKEVRPVITPEVRFTTYTLRYNRCGWLTIHGLEKHWERGFVHGTYKQDTFTLTTQGVTELSVDIPAGPDENVSFQIGIDAGAAEKVTPPAAKIGHGPLHVRFRKGLGRWIKVDQPVEGLAKVHGLQGPIDDAFMSSFLMVRPTGKPRNIVIGNWTKSEFTHAVDHWRNQFRGNAPIKDDKDITENDIKSNHLILWGDDASNSIIAKIADKLPLIVYGDKTVTLMIYPNPLNPKKYIVLNSGFTFREYDYLNNARQIPKLPDYAIVDVSSPINSRYPGAIVRAGFFDESWKLQKNDGKD